MSQLRSPPSPFSSSEKHFSILACISVHPGQAGIHLAGRGRPRPSLPPHLSPSTLTSSPASLPGKWSCRIWSLFTPPPYWVAGFHYLICLYLSLNIAALHLSQVSYRDPGQIICGLCLSWPSIYLRLICMPELLLRWLDSGTCREAG